MHEIIKITEAEFKKFRPLNGYIVLKPEQDVASIMVGGRPFFYDGSWTPEDNQVVVNRVVKVPDSEVAPEDVYVDERIQSEILLSVGSLVWVNYFSVLQAQRIQVILETAHVNPNSVLIGKSIEEYRIVSYRQCYMGLDAHEDEGGEPVYYMLNDYILLTPQERMDMNPLLPDPARRKVSRRFYTVDRVPFYGSFRYAADEYPPIRVEPGDIVFLRDANQFKLEHAPHYIYDRKMHYVTRVEKVMAKVDNWDADAMDYE